jgi:pimeloyl-ACP methyl ester carboxylesterase
MRASDGVELAVTEFGGSGTPILLLHGLMGRASTWWAVAEWLADHGRVVGLDARGHGRSGARGPWTTDRMAADVVDVLTELGPSAVLGHSMGGLHGLVAAARRPELVRALVVEDMGVDFRGRSAADARAWFTALPQPFGSLAAVRRAFGHPRIEFGEYMTECVEERADGYHVLARVEHTTAIAAEWAECDRWSEVESVRCPALLVEAEESVAPAGQMALMAARMPAAAYVRVPGAGHLVRVEPGFRPLIESFLSTHM